MKLRQQPPKKAISVSRPLPSKSGRSARSARTRSRVRLPDPHQQLLTRFQAMPERLFTNDILVPLLSCLGFAKVDPHHGIDEGGKDVICWGVDRLSDTELTVVQVKRFCPARRAADSKSLLELLRQFDQAFDTKVEHDNGHRYFPTSVWFVTPYCLDTRTLSSCFGTYQKKHRRGFRVLDGSKLLALITRYMPQLLHQDAKVIDSLHAMLATHLSNDILMNAVNWPDRPKLASFYVDLGLTIGGQHENALLLGRLKSAPRSETLDSGDLDSILPLQEACSRVLNIPLVHDLPGAIAELAMNNRLRARNRDARNDAQRRVTRLERKWEDSAVALTDWVEDSGYPEETMTDVASILSRLRGQCIQAQFDPPTGKKVAAITNDALGMLRHAMEKHDVEANRTFPQNPVAVCVDSFGALLDGYRSLADANRRVRDKVSVSFNCDGIARALRTKHEAIADSFRRLEKTRFSRASLTPLLAECEELFCLLRQLHRDRTTQQVLFASGEAVKETESFQVRLPVGAILATGRNLCLLGEAGAGKTTTMQIYAMRRLADVTKGAVVLYVPLARLNPSGTRTGSPGDHLLDALAAYCRDNGVVLSGLQLRELLEHPGSILLLDGVDEAVHVIPWLVPALSAAALRLPSLQIVVSSRVGGEFVWDLPFLALTLLPFTPVQRDKFIRDWCGRRRSALANHVLGHLRRNRGMAEVVTNPLAATLLGILARHGIPLPDTEMRLYEERMRLLLGDYDRQKGTGRKITTMRYDLETICRKAAFGLHSRGERRATRQELVKLTYRLLRGRMTREALVRGVEELISPCCILVPMSLGGEYGFGHLRYQEFLVAKEMQMNRAISVTRRLSHSWWRGPIRLLARMVDNLDWLEDWPIKDDVTGSEWETIREILKARPDLGSRRLREFARLAPEVDGSSAADTASLGERRLPTEEIGWGDRM